VRFALRGTSGNPGSQAPRLSGASFKPTLTSGPNRVTVSFTSNWDRDDSVLTYRIKRNGVVVWTKTAESQWWNLPTQSFTDTGLAAHTTYTYQLTATDPHGNAVSGTAVSVTTQ